MQSCRYKTIVGIEFRYNKLLYIGSQNAQVLPKWIVFWQHNFDKTPLPAQAPEFHNGYYLSNREMLLMF
jgi:DNA polymerase-3 subunit alpha/error-prone DNA polymerase